MNITGSRDDKVFFIDNDKVMIDGKMYYEKSPQNLPRADAYSLLGEVVKALIDTNEFLDELYVAHGDSGIIERIELNDEIINKYKNRL